MSRINYSDDEEWTGQFDLWTANVHRSIKGKAGQRELRELEAALVALPDKRLIHGALFDDQGGVCAIACYAKHKGLDLSTYDPEGQSDEVGIAAGMPRLVAWEVVAMNDVYCEDRWDDISKRSVFMTPEERYEKVLGWVRDQLAEQHDLATR